MFTFWSGIVGYLTVVDIMNILQCWGEVTIWCLMPKDIKKEEKIRCKAWMFKNHCCSHVFCIQRSTHPPLDVSLSLQHTHARARTHTRRDIWLSTVTDVLTVWKSGGIVVVLVLKGLDTRCISIHYTHATLYSESALLYSPQQISHNFDFNIKTSLVFWNII